MNWKVNIAELDLFYGKFQALKAVTMHVEERKITALIGPSGCGKSTLLRCLNRMNDTIPGVKIRGRITLDGQDIHARGVNVEDLRKRVGMVFQRPNPFPLSVFENVAFGLRVAGVRDERLIRDRVERSLTDAWLAESLKGNLRRSALDLPLDQQQRLCIARLLAVEPEVILMDEPCSALDPIATAKIEELMVDLRKHYTILIVTHNMQQAARVSDFSGYMLLGEMIEFDATQTIFTNPANTKTQEYISGRFG